MFNELCLKVTTKKNCRSQNVDFLSLKNLSQVSFGELQLTEVSLNFKTFCYNVKIRGLGPNCVSLFYYFDFERNYGVLKSKSPCILLNININFNENETESKMVKPTHSFKETNLVLQLI